MASRTIAQTTGGINSVDMNGNFNSTTKVVNPTPYLKQDAATMWGT